MIFSSNNLHKVLRRNSAKIFRRMKSHEDLILQKISKNIFGSWGSLFSVYSSKNDRQYMSQINIQMTIQLFSINTLLPYISIDITIRVLTLLLFFSEKLFRFPRIYSNFNKKDFRKTAFRNSVINSCL